MNKSPEILHKLTRDGSSTLFRSDLNEPYHSFHGAVHESLHVFIKMGLQLFSTKPEISIFEVGFGTGLNAWLTFFEKQKNQLIHYASVDAIPLEAEHLKAINYADYQVYENGKLVFEQLHQANWNVIEPIGREFNLHKQKGKVEALNLESNSIDLIYFDAFAPNKQPELWEKDIFYQMYQMLKPNGKLVTYCAKGQVRRNMQDIGFEVERLEGPPGKREMLRARKPNP